MSLNFSSMTRTDRSVYEFMKALDCPRSLTAWLMYSYGEHDQLAGLSFEPLHYNALADARDSLAATKYLSKATFLKTTYDLKKVAIEKFYVAEQQCAIANANISRGRFKNRATHDVLFQAAWKIANVLGEIDAEEFFDSCDWGPGASTSCRRRHSQAPNKYDTLRDCTHSAYDFLVPMLNAAYPSWDIPVFCIQEFSKIVTVPKNSKTDRVIAIEPDLNIYFQKGIGKMIRRRLARRGGINLNTQHRNQESARLGSKTDHLATVDFSAASDTISREVVEALLPRDWFQFLSVFRSSYTSVDGHVIRLEKFSSMGNGYTFELESLIFWSIADALCDLRGVSKSGLTVFGDDVVLPSSLVDEYTAICSDLGFTVNSEKSYSSTPFRESCGSYFWYGVDIKPIHLKEVLDDKDEALKAANQIRLFASRTLMGLGCDNRFRRAWSYIADFLGPKIPRIPQCLGDTGLIVSDDELQSYKVSAFPFEGYFIRAFVDRPNYCEFDSWGLLAVRLKTIGLSELEQGNKVPLPMSTKRSRKRILVPQCPDIGKWL